MLRIGSNESAYKTCVIAATKCANDLNGKSSYVLVMKLCFSTLEESRIGSGKY